MKYLLDSNVFIQAKNMYYRFDFCGGFWDWVKCAHDKGLVYTIKRVGDELQAGSDECSEWVKTMPKSFFVDDLNDSAVMSEYARIIRWANSSHYNPHAIAEFSKAHVADAFLIAAAKNGGYRIATQEQSKPESRRKIFLPDAAAANGVITMYVYDMLSNHTKSTFIHK